MEGKQQEARSLLGDFGNFMTSEPVLDLFRFITGADDIDFADSFAARYDPGDYTTVHDDGVDERKAAYVFGLTKSLAGGLGRTPALPRARRQREYGLIPAFNAFNLFSVPRPHSVTVVAPFAGEPRLTITDGSVARRR